MNCFKDGLALVLLTTTLSAAIPYQEAQGEVSLGYEEWKLPGDEKLGMSRISVLFDIMPWWYGGVDVYGAVKGDRGGFFTFGFDSGLKIDLTENVQLRSGLFVGAGGGGGAPQGGGLMLRPYAEARLHTETFGVGVGVSHVRFPNGDISSTQLFGNLYLPFGGSFWSGWPGISPMKEVFGDSTEWEGILRGGRYIVSSSSKTTTGNPMSNMSWMGIEVRRFYPSDLFLSFATSGAGGGDSSGYMEMLGGLGYRLQFGDWPLFATFQGELGMGGGGEVDTGGGTLWRVRSGLSAKINEHVTIGIEGGYIRSFQGSFEANSFGATLGYSSVFGLDDGDAFPDPWSTRMIHKSHFESKGTFVDPNDKRRIDLMGVAFDHYTNPYVYMTGQALWAYNGKAGGYTEGLLGLGVQSYEWNGWRVWSEALIGVGGGGGVQTGGGALGSLSAGIVRRLSENIDLQIAAGYTESLKGGLSTFDGTVQLRYRFSLPTQP